MGHEDPPCTLLRDGLWKRDECSKPLIPKSISSITSIRCSILASHCHAPLSVGFSSLRYDPSFSPRFSTLAWSYAGIRRSSFPAYMYVLVIICFNVDHLTEGGWPLPVIGIPPASAALHCKSPAYPTPPTLSDRIAGSCTRSTQSTCILPPYSMFLISRRCCSLHLGSSLSEFLSGAN